MEKQNDRQRLGRRIAELRNARGYTLAKLSELTGIAPGNIARIESGKHSVGVDIMGKLASALGVRIDFVEGDNPNA